MRWIGVSVAALSFVFAAGTAIADHQGGSPGGGEGAGSGSSFTPSPQSTIPGYRLIVRNRCPQTVSMSYRVKDYTGLWVTRGWFHVGPGRSRTLSMPTKNKIFYYYGYTSKGTYTWGGKGKTGSVRRWVRTKRFMHSSGNLSGNGARMVSFRKRTVPSSGIYRLNMTCRN